MQNIIIWRHAEAADGANDLKRPLTKKGQQQADKMAKWITHYFPSHYQLYTSEAQRTQQTAIPLNHNYQTTDILNPSGKIKHIIKFILQNIQVGNLILVGHQPWIGQLCLSLLIQEADNENRQHLPLLYPVKKASIWWFELDIQDAQKKEYYCKLKAVLSPNLVD